MGDDQRRERKQFEPPPWEKEAFEALAAKRAEQDAAASLAAEALAAAPSQEAMGEPAPVGAKTAAPLVAGSAEATVAPDAVAPEAPVAKAAAEPDSKVVQMMMMQLASEEATDGGNTKIVAWIAAGVTAVLGLAMVIAGVALATQAAGKSSALIGSAVLTIFGLTFMGMAAWVWISSNRVRGR